MEPAFLGLVLDSSVIIDAERNRRAVIDLLAGIRQRFGDIEVCISAVTVAELVHGVARAKTPEQRSRRRAFIDDLKTLVPIHRVTEVSAEIAGTLSGEQAAKGIVLPFDDLLIGVAAIEQGYAVVTLNERHFKKIPGLTVIRP